jgi:hypothetical protein
MRDKERANMVNLGVIIMGKCNVIMELADREQIAQITQMILRCEGSSKAAFVKDQSQGSYNGMVIQSPDAQIAVCREILIVMLSNESIVLIDENRKIEKFLFDIAKKNLTSDLVLCMIEEDFERSMDIQLTKKED